MTGAYLAVLFLGRGGGRDETSKASRGSPPRKLFFLPWKCYIMYVFIYAVEQNTRALYTDVKC